MWDSFKSAWDRLAAEGMISEAERLAISFPSYYRSMKEVEEGAKAVENIKVVSVEEKVRVVHIISNNIRITHTSVSNADNTTQYFARRRLSVALTTRPG